MPRPRLTIAALIAVVFVVAVGFAALRNADNFWASATFTFAVVAVAVALVGACFGEGKARMPFAGFAACGLICLIIWLTSHETVGHLNGPPRQLAFWGLSHLQPYINPSADAGKPYINYVQISNSLETILVGLLGATLCCFIPVKRE